MLKLREEYKLIKEKQYRLTISFFSRNTIDEFEEFC